MNNLHHSVLKRSLMIVVGILFPFCAGEQEEYVGSLDPTVEITYMLADFEHGTNRVGEWEGATESSTGIDAGLYGYMYTYIDRKCRNSVGPVGKYVIPENMVDNPELDGSTAAFRMKGNSLCDGNGLGGYFQHEADGSDVEGSVVKMTRDFKSKGQTGAVFWAKGMGSIRLSLNMRQMVPLNVDTNGSGTWDIEGFEDTNNDGILENDSGDGGICDPLDNCFDFHMMEFEIDGQWREYKVDFRELRQRGFGKVIPFDIDDVVALQLTVVPISDPRGTNEYDLWIDNIGLYGGERWEFMEPE